MSFLKAVDEGARPSGTLAAAFLPMHLLEGKQQIIKEADMTFLSLEVTGKICVCFVWH